MDLILVQNAEALPKEQDPDRPLTARGIETASQLGKFFKSMGFNPRKIYHSPKERSRQTAEIIGKALSNEVKLQLFKGLLPGDSIADLLKEIKKIGEDSIIVGHEPTLSKLSTRLLVKSKVSSFFQMEPGCCVWLSYDNKHKECLLKGFFRSQALYALEKRINGRTKKSTLQRS
ncbi:phosphohistidine phosphatase SixA [Candidatus Methylacidiphilum infernorum]|uniref:Phosphohistidine phosphatase SixA n=1 Tax=Candidatus Methylacidiphilum infernorum TaxID=511746 RepID=A0ABX7PTD7_9BACT|nr:phosphohistidine phosphatase SixA [Candidatus Methylacidiphilum infernorum]QSR86235.1 phosphohistidine phosphatase SixA [Candidatus Methylacidiphilum infernorum]